MQKALVDAINKNYDDGMFSTNSSYNKIGFFNVGYWKGIEDSIEMAQINLIETLVKFFNPRFGNVLDIACGRGASSMFITKYFDAEKITGINISEKQLDSCRLLVPGSKFLYMNATDLKFVEESFDNILCVEAAFHFCTRKLFFQEAYRVLRNGGKLALWDILFNSPEADQVLPWENNISGIDAYRELLLSAGFQYVRVEECTEFALNGFLKALAKQLEESPNDEHRKEEYRVHARLAELAPKFCMAYAIK